MPQHEFTYLIVRKPGSLQTEFMESSFAREHADLLQQLRTAGAFLNPSAYRGVGRDPLQPYPSPRPETQIAFQNVGFDVHSNRVARERWFALTGANGEQWDHLPTLEIAVEIHKLLDAPFDHEIIGVAYDATARTDYTLGYDIGYRGGDHFSLIADTFVHPQWHPPAPEDFAQLANQLRPLNQHLLFDSPDAAAEFLAYYKTKSWAEPEDAPGQFAIIRVDSTEA